MALDAEKIADLERKLAEGREESAQEKTWKKTIREGGNSMRILQMEKHYLPLPSGSSGDVESDLHPLHHLIFPGLPSRHPKPSTLLVTWSPSGKWVRVSRVRDAIGGPDYHNFKVGWIEMYVDEDGIIKEAVAYGDEDEKRLIWYNVEEMQNAMKWIIPEKSPWVTSRKWINEYKRPTNSTKSERGARGAQEASQKEEEEDMKVEEVNDPRNTTIETTIETTTPSKKKNTLNITQIMGNIRVMIGSPNPQG